MTLAETIANLAWAALSHPLSNHLPASCRRLLGEAAAGQPLCNDAAITIMRIAADLLKDGDDLAPSTWGARS